MTTAEDGAVSSKWRRRGRRGSRWVLRLHLRPGQRVACAHVDDAEVDVSYSTDGRWRHALLPVWRQGCRAGSGSWPHCADRFAFIGACADRLGTWRY